MATILPTLKFPQKCLWQKHIPLSLYYAETQPPSSAKVKKTWSYTSPPPTHLHGMMLSYEKHRTPLPFTL